MSSPLRPDPGAGQAMHALIAELFPICRSITGDGIRRTLGRIGELIPLQITEIPTGTPILDWRVPKEWNIREAWIADASGRRVVDFQEHNLHVVSYSIPVRKRMPLSELRPRLHSLAAQPDLIPYRTSYYEESWGFCLAERVRSTLPEGEYEVCIDSTLAPGHLTYGECLLPGATEDEVLLSIHVCHPSLANDNLSGIAVAVALAETLAKRPRRHTFRLLFIPGTIGSIAWLARNEPRLGRIKHGLVLSCLGDPGPSSYKRSRRGNAPIDRAAVHVLRTSGACRIRDFEPYGYDERQYCSPGFDLPVGCLTRSPNGRFPEYHTSADNLDFVRPEALEDSLGKLLGIVEILEHDARYLSQSPKGEPQLGRRGLYRRMGGTTPGDLEMAILWVLNLSDGLHSLLDIAERGNVPFHWVRQAASLLVETDLLRPLAGMESALGAGPARLFGVQ